MKRILFIQFANLGAYPPVQHAGEILLSSGNNVTFLGIKWPSDIGCNIDLPVPLRNRTSLLICPKPGLLQKLFLLYFIAYSLYLALFIKPSCVYVSDPLATPAGLLLSLMGFCVAYHEHDSPVSDPHSAYDKILLWSRKQLARRTVFNVLPQEVRCHLFKSSTATTRPVLCVWNCPRRSEIAPTLPVPRAPEQPLGIYFHGSINLTRVPLTLIEAAGATGLPIRLRVVGYETIGSNGASESLQRVAKRYSPHLQLELPGPMSRNRLFSQLEGMHLGWVAFSEDKCDFNLRHLAGASNKAFDYLAAGLPLLVNTSQEWFEMFVRPGYALACDCATTEHIAKQLAWAYSNPTELVRMGEAGKLKILSEWNYENQFQAISERLEATFLK